jgi:ribonuclease P protein component
MKETLGPQERIRKKKDFDTIYKNGNRFRGKYLTLVYLDNHLAFSRLGVVASRKVGGAVMRNRIKRRMREFFRRNKILISRPVDMVAIAKGEAASISGPEFRQDFLSALRGLEKRRPAR